MPEMKVTKSGGVMYIEYGDQRLMLVSKYVNAIQVRGQSRPTLTIEQIYQGIENPVWTNIELDSIADAHLLYNEILRANHLGEFEEEKETSRILH